MKAVVFAGRAALCVAVLAAASASAALEGWWRFAEPEAADASEDLSGNGRHVFLATNAVLKASDGPGGGSAWFDGRSDAKPHPGEFAYAFAPDFDESSVTGAFTVAAWVCPGAAGAYSPIAVCSSDPDGWTDGFGLFLGEGGEAAAFRSCGGAEAFVSGGALAPGVWRHVAARFDGRALSLWVDGRRAGEAAAPSGGCEPAPLALGTIVGRGPAQPFSGGVADVRVWSSALADSEIASAYRQFVGGALDPEGDDDGDGMPNGWEAFYGLDPRDAADAGADPDGDGVSNLAECRLGRSPRAGVRRGAGLLRSVTATAF